EKFQQHQELAAARRRASVADSPGEPRFGLGTLAIVAVLAAAAMYLWMHRNATVQPSVAASGLSPGAAQRSPGLQAVQASTAATDPNTSAGAPHQARPGGGSNALEAARSATVLIKTGWGLGTGFIIDDWCHVITNRHVVDTDGARVASRIVQEPEVRSR